MPRAPIPASTGTPWRAGPWPAAVRRRDASSQRSLLHLIGDVVAGAHRQRENRPRRVLICLRHEGPAVGDEQVLTVVRLAPAVRHGGLGIVPHTRPAQLVDDDAAGGDAVPLLGGRHRREHLTTHLGDERPERLLHVFHLLVFVIRPLPVESQHGDAPPVHRAGVDLAVAVVVRDHLAAAREADRGAVVAAVVVLELLAGAAARGGAGNPPPEAVGRHLRAAPDFRVVAARGNRAWGCCG